MNKNKSSRFGTALPPEAAGCGPRVGRAFLLAALLVSGPVQASDPVFLALLEGDAELETAFPGEVVETVWRSAELRERRCRVGASDPAWLQRVEVIAADRDQARAIAAVARDYLLQGALQNLDQAGLDPALLTAFRGRAGRMRDDTGDFGSCRVFFSVLQQIYDQAGPGEATPAVVGTVCGQVQALIDCHGTLPESAATLPEDGTAGRD
jgi:hypothetical protein